MHPFPGSSLRTVLRVLTAVLVLVLAVRAVAQSAGVALHSLVRDGNQVADLDWYVGSVSLVGVVVWASGSAVALAASFWVDGADRGFLRAFGVFGLVLAVDDGLMIHDVIVPNATNTMAFEPVVFAAYGSVAAWITWRFLPVLTPTAVLFGAASATLLGTSILVDLTDASSAFAEDTLKFAGIVAWAGLAFTQAGHAVRGAAASEVVVPERVATPD